MMMNIMRERGPIVNKGKCQKKLLMKKTNVNPVYKECKGFNSNKVTTLTDN
eukprot:c44846_g1_i1 orf=163-315(+)